MLDIKESLKIAKFREVADEFRRSTEGNAMFS